MNKKAMLVTGVLGGGGGENVILFDQFTGVDDTSLDAHIILPINKVSASWVEANGDLKIKSGYLTGVSSTTSPYSIATIDAGRVNYKIQAKINLAATVSNENAGVIVRYATGPTFYLICFNTGYFRIYEYAAGHTERAVVAHTFSNNTDYLLTVIVSDNKIIATVDGVSLVYANATRNPSSTIVGARIQVLSQKEDDFKVIYPFRMNQPIALGDVYLILGQSNAEGVGTNNQAYTGTGAAYLFANNYAIRQMADPTDSNSQQVDSVSSDADAAGSYWPILASYISNNTGRVVTFIPCAKGGSTIFQWQPGANHEDRTTLIGSAIYRAKLVASLGGNLRGALWHQGEGDAANSISQEDYNNYLDIVADTLRSDLGIPLVPCKLQNCTGRDETNVNAAIAEAWVDNENVLQGPDFTDITPSEDGLHFKTDEEQATAGLRWWNEISIHFYS